jgi:hypothetical protein
MELCKKIEDLTCMNCIYSHLDREDDEGTYCYYNYIEPEDCSDRWVSDNFFCHNGEWAAKVKVEETTYLEGRKVSSTMEECVKVAGRAQMISCFLNDNVFDWL